MTEIRKRPEGTWSSLKRWLALDFSTTDFIFGEDSQVKITGR